MGYRWGHVLWVITWVGSFVPGSLCGVENGVTHVSGGANYLPKFLPISFFRRASRFIGVSGHLALQ